MDSTWSALATFLSVYVVAILSPGPNFVLVTNTALGESRRAGLLTALGVAVGSLLFALAGLGGLLVLVDALPHFATILRFVGGSYLVWIGFTMLRKVVQPVSGNPGQFSGSVRSNWNSLQNGLLTNLTNPKAWAFYLSLFTMIITPHFTIVGKSLLALAMFLISMSWYMLVAVLISSHSFQPTFLRWRPWLQGTLGGLLVLFGARLLLT
ncbi:MAG: hypothetical protein C0614_02570 [Desulfuromonas sp.]|nr:MAG: hypothetical protein C0614_02570 [Desulfuromonas sp.]